MATVSTFNIALVASTGRFVSSIAKAERQWNSFSRSVQRQAKTLPKSIREAVPASLALGRNVVKWTAVASAALTGLGAAGVKLAADFEQSQIAFETLLGSAERANRFLRELEVYARRTPFGFVGLQQASRQLLAYGFTAGRVLDMIEPIGDAVAAMGGSNQMFEAIIRALGQIQAKGKLAAQEFLQLSEQGIPAWQFLADMLGVTIPEAMDMASRGMISSSVAIEAVLTGMTRRFGGAMRRQADTILGRWEQIKDGLATITRGFGEDVIRILGVGRAMEALAGAVERFADAVSLRGFLTALRESFPPWVQPVIVAIAGAIIGGLVPAIIAWLVPALKKLSVSLLATLKPLVPWMAIGAAVAVVAYVLAKNWGNLAEVGQRVWTVLGASAMLGAALVVRGSGVILQALSWIVPTLSGVAQEVLEWSNSLRSTAVEAIKSATSMSKVGQEAGSAAGAAEEAAWAQEQLAEGLEMAQKAAQGGVQSFDEVHQIQENMADFVLPDFPLPDFTLPNIETPTAALAEGLEAMEDAISGIADAAVKAFQRLVESLGPVNTAVEWMRDNWPTIGPIIEGIASALSVLLIPALINTGVQASIAFGKMAAGWIASGAEAAVSAGAQVAHFATLVGKWILLGLEASAAAAKAVAAWVMQGLEAASSVAIQAVHFATLVGKWVLLGAEATIQGAKIAAAWVASMGPVAWVIATIAAVAVAVALNWDEVKAVTERVWSGISTWLSDTWEGIKSLASSIWDGIKNVIGIAWDAIKGAAITVWDAIAGALKTAWDGIVLVATAVWDGLKSVIGTAWDAISLAATTAWEGIKTVLSAIWDGITFVATTVWDGIVSIVTGTWDAIKTVAGPAWEGIKTVLSVAWDAIAGVATTVWDGLVTGVSSAWDSISKASNAVWTTIKESLSGLWDGIASLAGTVWGGIKSAIGTTWGSIEKTTQKLWDGLSKWLDDSWNSIRKTAKAIWDKIPKPITDAVSASVKSVTGFAKDVIKWVDDMGTKALKAVQDMANGIVQWIRDLPKRTMDSVKSWTTGVIDSVRNMYKTIVGGSIIPDMVKESVGWFDILKNQSVAIVGEMGQGIVSWVANFTDSALGKMGSFGEAFQSIAQQISTGMQSVFGQAFDGIISGSMTMGEAFQSVLSGMGAVLKNVLVQQLSQAASNALSTLGSWIISVLSKVATAISAVITQAYTTLVAFYAWSGPAAPVLAAGTIAAAIAGIGALAAKAVGAFKGVTGLAKGGIVTGPTLAMVGEGHRREAVIPLERDNVIAESVGAAVFDAMMTAHRFQQASGPGPAGDDREVVLRIDGATFARLILPHLVREGQRQGMDVVIRPALGV